MFIGLVELVELIGKQHFFSILSKTKYVTTFTHPFFHGRQNEHREFLGYVVQTDLEIGVVPLLGSK